VQDDLRHLDASLLIDSEGSPCSGPNSIGLGLTL